VLAEQNQYLRGAIAAAQFSAGANPENLAYTTGLVADEAESPLPLTPQHPLVIDQRVQGKAPPPGITVYGPLDAQKFGTYWGLRALQPMVFPALSRWPTAESYLDVFLLPAVTEFTLPQTIGPTAYTWGYLAARCCSARP
jgi:endoglucanase